LRRGKIGQAKKYARYSLSMILLYNLPGEELDGACAARLANVHHLLKVIKTAHY
jgi:hypothetical protein